MKTYQRVVVGGISFILLVTMILLRMLVVGEKATTESNMIIFMVVFGPIYFSLVRGKD